MGWYGYTIYSGDDTQTWHYNFIKWSGIKVTEDQIMEDEWVGIRKTKIPDEYLDIFKTGLPKVIKKMPKKRKFWKDEYSAIEWHMLLALCVDNKVKSPKIIYDIGLDAVEYLMGAHASDFKNPSRRRRNLRNFIQRAKKLGYSEKSP